METKAPMGVGTSNNNNSFSAREEVEHVIICKYIVSNRLMCRRVVGARSKISCSWSMSMVGIGKSSAVCIVLLCCGFFLPAKSTSRFLLPIPSRQIDESISIADFFNHNNIIITLYTLTLRP